MRLVLLALIVVVCGCPGPAPSTCDGVAPAKLSDVQASIFTPSCATTGCHTGGAPAQELSLDPGKSFDALVNRHSTVDPAKILVKPNDPAGSELYRQVQSGEMPQTGDSLSSDQLAQLRGWICAGAPND